MFLHVEASPDMTLREAHEYVVMFEKALGKRLNTTRIETHIEPEDRLCAPENALPFDADLHYVRAAVDSILPEFPMVSNVHDLRLTHMAGRRWSASTASSTAICPLPPPTMSPRTWNAASAPAHPSSTASSSTPTRPPLSSCLRRDSGACLNLFGKDERQTTKTEDAETSSVFHSGKLGAGIQ